MGVDDDEDNGGLGKKWSGEMDKEKGEEEERRR